MKKVLILVSVALCFSLFGCATQANKEAQATNQEVDEVVVVVDKDTLNEAITEYSKVTGDKYTTASFSALTSAINAAKKLKADNNATQEEVDNAVLAMNKALEGLEKDTRPQNYRAVSYTDVERTPKNYEGMNLVFSGKVLQVIESDKEIDLRVATDGDMGDVVMIGYSPDLLSFRVLAGDTITAYGTFIGVTTYKSTDGVSITVPGLSADVVEIKKVEAAPTQ